MTEKKHICQTCGKDRPDWSYKVCQVCFQDELKEEAKAHEPDYDKKD